MSCILASRFKVYAFCRLRKAQQFVHVVDEEVAAYIRFMTQKAGMYTSFPRLTETRFCSREKPTNN